MLTLLTYPAGYNQPSLSPFCVKAMYLLNMSGQAWQIQETNDPRKAPRAKLPVLRTPHGLVHDSSDIQSYLETKGADFDGHLTDSQAATAHAMKRMIEEHMYFILVLDRWERPTVWPTIRDTYFDEIPAILRGFVTNALRKQLIKGLKTQGLGRMTWEERMARAEQDLNAVTTTLGDTEFLFGDKPSSADASVVAALGAMRATPVSTPLSNRIGNDPILSGYVDRAARVMGSQ